MVEGTYGRLDQLLRSLGFTMRLFEGKTRVYEHPETGALMAVPTFPMDTPVYPHHLLGVRAMLKAYGLADPTDFERQLQKAG